MPNYYNNREVQDLIEDYLEMIYKTDDKKFLLKEDTPENRMLQDLLKEKIFKEVSKIINGIIFTHKFTVWEPYDDLFQEASEACIKALPKFNPNYVTSKGIKATSFNYFSLTAKRCLKFYTMRNQKNRNHLPIEDYNNATKYKEEDMSKSIVFDDFIRQLKTIFVGSKYKKFIPLIDRLEEYLQKIGDFNKRDFFRFAKSYGWSPNLIRKFLKNIKENKESFYKDHDVKNATNTKKWKDNNRKRL